MKKLIALVLCALMVTAGFAGCGSDEKQSETKAETKEGSETANTLMPTKLSFGITYDEAKKINENIPELVDATANDGYFCSNEIVEASVIKEFYGIDSDMEIWDPTFSYSFNENKLMYEFYILAELDSEGDAESIFNTIMDYYDEETGVEADVRENDAGLDAKWETKENGISISVGARGGNIMFYVTIHNFENELKD